MILLRNQKDSRLFKYDKRKSKKVSPLATLLIEHLTEESNGSITAAAINFKTNFKRRCPCVNCATCET